MKKTILIRSGIAAAFILTIVSCKDTWLMYDPSQKDHLYFEITSLTPLVSFSLTTDQEIQYQAKVLMMGMPVDYDRTFTVSFPEIGDDEKVTVGTETMPVVKARPDTDYEIGSLTLPAGEVECSIPLTIHRQEVMKDKYVCIRFRITEDEEFLPLPADSSNLKKIKSPLFNLYINDGEPACPDWWDATAGSTHLFGWTLYLGRFYPEKFRRMLDLYHNLEEKNPIFYQTCVDRYGENLDKEGITKNFFVSENPSAWASYILSPMYEYYKVYYAEHPDDPNVETMGSGTSGNYWRDPIYLLR
ncbi:MAG: DUF4843 domain-containing protein [Alistipes sp.]|nr:DUF4843 domain-containing protein [Alistipes sp.]